MTFQDVKLISIAFPVSILWDFEVSKKNTKRNPISETHNLMGFDPE